MQKGRILYIGNKHSKKGMTVTSVETLGVFLESEGFKVITASSVKNKVLRLCDMIIKTIKFRNQVDVVLIDTYSTQNFYYAITIAVICRIFRMPYIPILHGGNLPNRLKRNNRLSDFLFKKAKANVAPSQFIKREFERYGYTNIVYIPNTIDLTNYPFQKRNKIEAKLLWVRSFAEIYNPLLALQVVEELQKNGTSVELCMVGPEKDGSLLHCKKIAQQLNLPITFKGKLEKSEWITLSKQFDIFINTTNFDNMPVSVMEAMALGLVVISTDVGGMPYLIKNNESGILLPPNNVAGFVGAINNILEQPRKAHMLAQNARKEAENFDWAKIKHSWFDLLKQ